MKLARATRKLLRWERYTIHLARLGENVLTPRGHQRAMGRWEKSYASQHAAIKRYRDLRRQLWKQEAL